MKNEKILISGPYGFVGSEIVRQLKDNNELVINHKNFDLSESKIPLSLEDKNLQDVTRIFFCADISVKEWRKNPGLAFDKQLKMQSNIVEFWKNTSAQLICFASHTMWPETNQELFENNIDNGKLIPEWEFYGQCKRTFLSQLKAADHNKKWLMLGLATQFGPNDNSNKFIPTVIKNLDKEIIECMGKPDDYRSFSFIEDTVQNIINLLKSEMVDRKVINIGGFHNMKVCDVVNSIIKISGKNPKIDFNSSGTFWNSSKRFFNSDLYNNLQFKKTITPFEDAIRKTLSNE